MKRFLFTALAALTLLFLAGCAAKPAEPETAEYYLTDEDVPLDERALSRAVPDFLTEEQQTLYRQAAALYDAMLERAGALTSLSEAESVLGTLQELEPVDEFRVREVDLGTGTVSCELHLPQALFYEELSRQAGVEIADDEALLQMLQELAQTKKLYDKVQTALEQVKATGYGIVMPGAEELKLEKPEIVKKNGNYAVKLRASAPSIHMLRAQIETEISPMVGGEQESQQLIDYLLGEYEEDTDKLWQSNIFGKSLYELVSEGVTAKIMRMPDDARQKLTKTLGRMINENTGGMICILL